MEAAFNRLAVIAASLGLDGIEHGISYGTPALKARGKLLVRVKDAETLVFMCPHEEKTMLMQADPAIFYETDHYKGYPAVLLNLRNADDATIAGRIAAAWRMQVAGKQTGTRRRK
jgi:hypothetical protein